MKAILIYPSEWQRGGQDWKDFMTVVSRYYGKIVGVKRAEAFYSPKCLL